MLSIYYWALEIFYAELADSVVWGIERAGSLLLLD